MYVEDSKDVKIHQVDESSRVPDSKPAVHPESVPKILEVLSLSDESSSSRSFTIDTKTSVMNNPPPPKYGSSEYKCSFCPYVAESGREEMFRHLRDNHTTSNEMKSETSSAVHGIGKSFKLESDIRDTTEAVVKKEKPTPDELEEDGQRLLTVFCDKCDFVTSSVKLLRIHSSHRHVNKDRFSCKQCEYKTSTREVAISQSSSLN